MFHFRSKVWKYSGKAAWYFVSLPLKISEEIKSKCNYKIRGYGSISVEAMIHKTKWKSSLFFSKEHKTYLLPLKIQIRKSENINEGDLINIYITLI